MSPRHRAILILISFNVMKILLSILLLFSLALAGPPEPPAPPELPELPESLSANVDKIVRSLDTAKALQEIEKDRKSVV
jgi:hypothetical protein